jgi:Tfp pilus assembly protein PilE
MIGKRGQGESLIKLLVVAIIAIIALALAKSYFRESSRATQRTVEEVFDPNAEAMILPLSTPTIGSFLSMDIR